MKIICNKSDLLKGVNIALRAVPVRTTMSILECIIIDATELEITLTSNDMELGIETKVKGDILEKGKVALDAKFLSEIVRKLPDSEVTIETDSNYVATITCEKSVFTISGKDGEDFSYLPYIERNQSVTLSQFTLKEIIRQTIFSIGDNESNKVMTGELFEINENNLRVVSLDRYRVSIRNVKLADNYNLIKVIVPGKTLNEISKILSGDTDSEVKIFFAENHIVFEFDDTVVVSRLIEGEFFKINQMLTKDHSTRIDINKKELLECIDRATLLVKEGNKKPVIFDIEDGSIKINIVSTFGKMNEEIDITKEGQDIKIGFDPKFLIDALRVIEDETISMFFMNAKAPCTIRDEEGSYIYLILPVNY
ncbi:MAG: DNA polymerase III subunit beta [Butyrivibrio sp.]